MLHREPSRVLGLLAAAGFGLAILSMAGGMFYSIATHHQLPDPRQTYDGELEELLHKRDFEAALPQLRIAASVDFDSEIRHWQLLEAAKAVNSVDDQHSALEALVRFNPDDADVRYWLAGIHLQQSDPQGAIAPASRAVELDPDNLNYLCRYGAALLAADQKAEAAAQYRSALEIEPDWEPARIGAGAPAEGLLTESPRVIDETGLADPPQIRRSKTSNP